MSETDTRIHSTAVVEDGVRLGLGARVGPLCYLQDGAEIGDRTELMSHVSVLAHSSVGADCRLHGGAVVGDLPQDVGFAGEESYVRIGDRCQIREGVTIHRGSAAGSSTVTGDDCMLMANSHLAHNVRLGDGVILANGVLLGGHVEVGDRVFMGGGVGVHQFVRIGRLAMISGLTAVKRDIPPFCMTRELTSHVMGLNIVGLRRGGLSGAERLELKRAFKLLYRSGLNTTQAVERMRSGFDSEVVAELALFVTESKRGISNFVETPGGDRTGGVRRGED